MYQNLALEALDVWKEWNQELAESSNLMNGLSQEDVLYVNSGSLNIFTTSELPPFEQQSLDNITAAGKGQTQFVVNRPGDRTRAAELGFGYALDPFYREARGKQYNALLDISGGLCYADKACLFALHKARELGVKFIFGTSGTFESFTYSKFDPSEVTGVRTADGLEHTAVLTIVAGGGGHQLSSPNWMDFVKQQAAQCFSTRYHANRHCGIDSRRRTFPPMRLGCVMVPEVASMAFLEMRTGS